MIWLTVLDLSSVHVPDSNVVDKDRLVNLLGGYRDLKPLFVRAVSKEEADTVPVCYYVENDILLRNYRPPEVKADNEWKELRQMVIPNELRKLLGVAHETPWAGHLGVNKMRDEFFLHVSVGLI